MDPIALLDQAATDGVCPGGVLVVGDAGRVVLRHAFGVRSRIPPGPPVTLDTIYDVASLTKAAVTSLLVFRLGLDLDAAVLPSVNVGHLLTHSSGLPAWSAFYQRATGRAAIIELCATAPLERPPGEASVYSDLGFIVLGDHLERSAGERLDALARRHIFEPFGMTASTFVDLAAPFRPSPVAATELEHTTGEVHDENCHAAGGILGHAGLFSTGDDLARLCFALVANVHPLIFTPSGVPGSTWRFGWDGPSPRGSSAGERWPKTGSGHLGFTGCSMWLDPARARFVILLTNRVHPTREDTRIKQLRPAVQDAVVAMLDG